jgi:hypothetical protein
MYSDTALPQPSACHDQRAQHHALAAIRCMSIELYWGSISGWHGKFGKRLLLVVVPQLATGRRSLQSCIRKGLRASLWHQVHVHSLNAPTRGRRRLLRCARYHQHHCTDMFCSNMPPQRADDLLPMISAWQNSTEQGVRQNSTEQGVRQQLAASTSAHSLQAARPAEHGQA